MRHVIVDTNVPIVANQKTRPASPTCVQTCIRKLQEIQQGSYLLVLDNRWHILREYMNNLRSTGEPGVGDAFLKWVLTNRTNPICCELIPITLLLDSGFAEFPQDQALASFDPSDRKFVAVALSHPQKPPILNATDTDWWIYQQILAQYDIRIEFLCPDAMQGSEIISPQTI